MSPNSDWVAYLRSLLDFVKQYVSVSCSRVNYMNVSEGWGLGLGLGLWGCVSDTVCVPRPIPAVLSVACVFLRVVHGYGLLVRPISRRRHHDALGPGGTLPVAQGCCYCARVVREGVGETVVTEQHYQPTALPLRYRA
jgi:hypothetical protein